ncbi:MAG: hypothetical protein JSV62_11140 [Promethearchaeota archaeon]|nr:MAG: hypothetical protein JSV62_11140 [Candidatus Lokiarchaeota archaeon]
MSHFDSIVGPMVFLNVPELPSQDVLEEIPRLLDFYKEGFFTYEFEDLKTSNLIFTVSSPIARGGEVNLMISIIVFDEENTDLSIFQDTLGQFAHELKQIKDIYKAFERDKSNSIDHHEISIKVEELLNSVYHALPKETISTEKKEINLAMFDFFEEGESKIAQLFRKFITNIKYYKSKSEDLNPLHYKIIVSSYPISNSKKSINFFLSQLKKKQGIIFVVDITNKTMIRKARHISNRIIRLAIGKLNIANMPCLILINKLGIYRYEIQKILRFLDEFGYDIKIVKYIPTDISNKDKINEAFNWIINRIILNKRKYQKEQK